MSTRPLDSESKPRMVKKSKVPKPGATLTPGAFLRASPRTMAPCSAISEAGTSETLAGVVWSGMGSLRTVESVAVPGVSTATSTSSLKRSASLAVVSNAFSAFLSLAGAGS